MASDLVHEITDANFQKEVYESELPVLLDFWAVWCGPCRMVGPIVEEIAGEYQGKLKVGKVDTDSNPSNAGKLGIRSIPTLMIFKGGQLVDTMVGARPKAKMVDWIEKNIG